MERKRLKAGAKAPEPLRLPGALKLDETLIRRFCRIILKGLPLDGCCDYLGINPSTFYAWLDKGKKYLDGGNKPPENKIYGLFVHHIRKAFGRYRLRMNIRAHKGGRYWVRDVTILERRDRRNYSRNEPEGGTEESFDPDERFI